MARPVVACFEEFTIVPSKFPLRNNSCRPVTCHVVTLPHSEAAAFSSQSTGCFGATCCTALLKLDLKCSRCGDGVDPYVPSDEQIRHPGRRQAQARHRAQELGSLRFRETSTVNLYAAIDVSDKILLRANHGRSSIATVNVEQRLPCWQDFCTETYLSPLACDKKWLWAEHSAARAEDVQAD
jgi:hypothetical protein